METNDVSNVIVLSGGPDAERDVSIASANAVHAALLEFGMKSTLVEINEPTLDELLVLLLEAASVDARSSTVVFPMLHGKWGEGGRLQAMLEELRMRFVGSRSEAAKLCMHKSLTKASAQDLVRSMSTSLDRELRVGVSDWVLVRGNEPSGYQDLPFAFPFVVKPDTDGSSFGVVMVESLEAWHDALLSAHARTQQGQGASIAEPRATGLEFTVGAICSDRSVHDQSEHSFTALPLVAIRPAIDSYDTKAKYERDDTTYEVRPKLPDNVEADAIELTLRLAQDIGIQHMCRADFIYDEAAGVAWFLEINTVPGFTRSSLLPMAASAAGLEMPQLCGHLVTCAAHTGH